MDRGAFLELQGLKRASEVFPISGFSSFKIHRSDNYGIGMTTQQAFNILIACVLGRLQGPQRLEVASAARGCAVTGGDPFAENPPSQVSLIPRYQFMPSVCDLKFVGVLRSDLSQFGVRDLIIGMHRLTVSDRVNHHAV